MGGGTTGNGGQVNLAQPWGYAQGPANFGGGLAGQQPSYNGMTPYTGTQQMGNYQQQAPWQWNPYQQQQNSYMQMMMQRMMQPQGGLLPRQQYSEGNVNYASPTDGNVLNRLAVAAAPQNFAGSGYEEVLAPVKKPVVINYENGGAGV